VQKGVFVRLCADAIQNTHQDYYLIIDEINRGDISRIFGELVTLLEAEKRGKKMILPLSGKPFHVPPNVYVIGTMNTADRSIALLDVALRRRFGFYELMPDYSLFDGITIGGLPLGLWLQDLNRRIVEHVGKDARNLQIGHAYFMHKGSPIKDLERLRKIVAEDVLPLLEEYCYGDYATVAQIIGRRFVDVERQRIEQAIFQKENELEFITALLEPNPTLATSFAVGEEDQDEGEDPNEATGEQGS
jgi:5-methylcytosine-specific restriction protein B